MQSRILVVDDEQLVRTALQLYLTHAGHAVELAESAEQALACLDTEKFDCVVTDNRMPGMTGLELAVAIRTRWPSLRIMMFTAEPPEEALSTVDLVLHKPADIPILAQSIRVLLERPA